MKFNQTQVIRIKLWQYPHYFHVMDNHFIRVPAITSV